MKYSVYWETFTSEVQWWQAGQPDIHQLQQDRQLFHQKFQLQWASQVYLCSMQCLPYLPRKQRASITRGASSRASSLDKHFPLHNALFCSCYCREGGLQFKLQKKHHLNLLCPVVLATCQGTLCASRRQLSIDNINLPWFPAYMRESQCPSRKCVIWGWKRACLANTRPRVQSLAPLKKKKYVSGHFCPDFVSLFPWLG